MAQRIVEIVIPQLPGQDRATTTRQVPSGAMVRAVIQPPGDSARIVLQGDPAQPLVGRNFSAVLSGVDLNAGEIAGTYLGSFFGFWREGQPARDIYYLFEV